MIKIGVISDTHIPKTAYEIPREVLDGFKGVDMIFHAGDLVEMDVFDILQKIAPTHAVCGNMDSDLVRATLPVKDVIKVGGFKIGLIHGYGPPLRVPDLVRKEFGKVSAIVFGHTHSALNEKVEDILFFNPGTPTDKIFAPYNSYGILEITDRISGRIVKIDG